MKNCVLLILSFLCLQGFSQTNIFQIAKSGTVDELNSHIGLIRDQNINQLYKNVLIED